MSNALEDELASETQSFCQDKDENTPANGR